MILSISQKEELITTLSISMNEKDEAIALLIQQNHSLNSMLYILK